MRVKRGFKRHRRRTKLLKRAKGFFLAKRNLYNIAKQAVEKALGYAYFGRRIKKRDYRGIWIVRVGAACRENGISYSRFINGLQRANIQLDRKVLSDIAIADPKGFAQLVATARKALAA